MYMRSLRKLWKTKRNTFVNGKTTPLWLMNDGCIVCIVVVAVPPRQCYFQGIGIICIGKHLYPHSNTESFFPICLFVFCFFVFVFFILRVLSKRDDNKSDYSSPKCQRQCLIWISLDVLRVCMYFYSVYFFLAAAHSWEERKLLTLLWTNNGFCIRWFVIFLYNFFFHLFVCFSFFVLLLLFWFIICCPVWAVHATGAIVALSHSVCRSY